MFGEARKLRRSFEIFNIIIFLSQAERSSDLHSRSLLEGSSEPSQYRIHLQSNALCLRNQLPWSEATAATSYLQ